MHLLTGSALRDGLDPLLIGVLLGVVAYLLGRTNMRLLIGQQADRRLVRRFTRTSPPNQKSNK
ncbi:MAG: hypothetical protein LC749_22480 [Actinobacteria bacterium]|nr:hypothetical protein [Actinomycetota bacterium]